MKFGMNQDSVVEIGGHRIGPGHPTFVIAEIGINHNGDLEIARKLIDAAIDAGCQAIKLQKRTIDTVYTPEDLARPRENPFGPTNGDLKRGLEFGEAEFAEIDRYCREKSILWFSSCWDEGSVDFMERFSPVCYKIASACLTDDALLRHHRACSRPIIASTGMSGMARIDHAIEVMGQEDLVLLHTTSTYPTEVAELNLLAIQTLAERYSIPVGYSGHEVGLQTSVAAVVLGACVVERHITLDRSMWGSDQAASIEPQGFARMVRDIRTVEEALGDGELRIFDSELPVMAKLRRVG